MPVPLHLEWYDLFVAMFLHREFRRLCIMAPKGHAKSTVVGKVIPLWLQCAHDQNFRGITGSINSELAERFNRANRSELERNALLINDWGPFKPDRPEVWRQDEYTISRESASASPTWRAVGSQKPVQGGRADGIFGDDLVDLDNARTQYSRDKFQEWFDGDLIGTLEPDGFAFIVGTAKNNDDLYHRIEKKAKSSEGGWVFKRYDAIVDEEAHQVLWPERWSWDALMAKKADYTQGGTLTFNRDYRNIAVNDETSLFPMRLLEGAKRHDLTFETECSWKCTAGVDLAVIEDAKQAQQSNSDYTVNEVWRIFPDGKRRLIWGERWRGLGFPEQVKAVTTTLRRYSGLAIATVESNQAQRWFASALMTASRGTLPIHKHSTTRAKADVYEGVPSLVALFEANLIELPYGDDQSRAFVDILIAELFGLGVEAHDDCVMSLYMNELGVRRIASGPSWGKVAT